MARMLQYVLSLIAAIHAEGQEIILQDAQGIGFSSSAQTCEHMGSGGSFVHNGGSFEKSFMSGSDKTFYEYHFEPTKDGCYKIEEWHPTNASACGVNVAPGKVPLQIDFCKGGIAHTGIRQHEQSNQWNLLMQLPFYVGYPGKIAVHRNGVNFPNVEEDCPDGKCLWMADAFKLTWLAETCSEADAIAREKATFGKPYDAVPPTAAEWVEEDLAKPSAEFSGPAQVISAAPMIAVQVVLSEPQQDGEDGVFHFDPPYDGCYMIEEHHPRIEDATREKLEVNYCKGLQSLHYLDHSDGRHHQWNYVNSLPFYAGRRGSVVVPWRILRERNDHDYRLTYVGPSCRATSSRPHSAKVRITANFSNVPEIIHELATFKTELISLLAPAAKIHRSRMRVTSLNAGSIIAEVLVLPPMSAHGLQAHPDDVVDAREAIENLEAALESEASLVAKLCDLARGDERCTVSLLSHTPTPPLPKLQFPASKAKSIEKQSMLYIYLGLVLCVVVASVSAGTALLLCIRKRKAVQVAVDEEAGAVAKAVPAKEVSMVVPKELHVKGKIIDEVVSNASTGTPDLQTEIDQETGAPRASISDDNSENSEGSGTRSEPSVVTAVVKSTSADIMT